jgi:hypothetical protein
LRVLGSGDVACYQAINALSGQTKAYARSLNQLLEAWHAARHPRKVIQGKNIYIS